MINKFFKGTAAIALALSMVIAGGVTGTTGETVYASDYTDEPVIFDVEYTGFTNAEDADYFVINVPSNGKLTLECYMDAGEGVVSLEDVNTGLMKLCNATIPAVGSGKLRSAETVEAGEYILSIGSRTGDGNYFFTCSYDFDSSVNAKVSSPKSGALKVTALNDDNSSGFQIRYKKAGASGWTVKTVKTTGNLKKTIKGLSSGSDYIVQTRKIAKDTYSYKYFSKWSNAQTITIK